MVVSFSDAEQRSPLSFPAPAKSKNGRSRSSLSYRSYRLAASAVLPRQAAHAKALLRSSLCASLIKLEGMAQRVVTYGARQSTLESLPPPRPLISRPPPPLSPAPTLAQPTRDDQM